MYVTRCNPFFGKMKMLLVVYNVKITVPISNYLSFGFVYKITNSKVFCLKKMKRGWFSTNLFSGSIVCKGVDILLFRPA